MALLSPARHQSSSTFTGREREGRKEGRKEGGREELNNEKEGRKDSMKRKEGMERRR